MKHYQKDYPRPQFVRKQWENLNGSWKFSFDDEKQGLREQWFTSFPSGMEIEVPFTYETKLSGIGDETHHTHVWYQKSIEVSLDAHPEECFILHFEGSDYITDVWVNGMHVGQHRGGYSRFSFDVTHALQDGENSIVVAVEDQADTQQPRGKQRWIDRNFGCWYVQTTGIWKTVWTEWVPKERIESVKLTPVLATESIEVHATFHSAAPAGLKLKAHVTYKDIDVAEVVVGVDEHSVRFSVPLHNKQVNEWGIATWGPGHPELYDVTFELVKDGDVIDTVGSYFGMREIAIDGQMILLNHRPLYQRLILDQGYWEDSHLTPPNEEALVEDIDKLQQLGYNGLRKHQKIEDERFLYWCDVKGMLVWSEFPATYEYSDQAIAQFTDEWLRIVRQNYNHPSIITWTPVNESWGVPAIASDGRQQAFTEAIYKLTKAIDPMRPVVVNDGWEHTISDIITLHDYEENGDAFTARYDGEREGIFDNTLYFNKDRKAFAEGYAYQGQPVIISEFGGIAFQGDEKGWAWGYGNKVRSKEDFVARFDAITSAIKALPYCVGFCYTQVTDVQQEVNGLMDIRRNFKIDPEIIKEINER